MANAPRRGRTRSHHATLPATDAAGGRTVEDDIAGNDGRGTRIRTRDLRIWNPLLYQLSYTPRAVQG